MSSTGGQETNPNRNRGTCRTLATAASASAADVAQPGADLENGAADLQAWEELHWNQEPAKTNLSGEGAYTQQTKFEMEVHQKRMMEVAQTLRQLMADTDTPVKQDGSVAKATKNIILMWWKPLAALIHEEQEKLHRAMTGDDRKKFTPYLMQVKADELAMLTVMEFLNLVLVNADGVRVVKAAQKIGRAVEAAVVMNRLKTLTRQQDRARRRQEETERKEVLERAQLQAKIEAEDAKLLSIDDIFEDTVFEDQRGRMDELDLGDDDSVVTSEDEGKRAQSGHMYRSVYKRLADQLNSKSHSPPSEEVSRKAREALQMHCQKDLLAGFDERDWDLASAVKVGSALLVRLLKTAKVWDDVLRPGWSEHYDEASGKTCYTLTNKQDPCSAQYPEVLATWWEHEDETGHTYYYNPVNDEKADKNPAKQRKKVDAFEHFYVTMHARRYGMLRCHDKVFDELIKSGGHALDQNGHDPKYLPMVCEPRPWVSHDEGGMLHLPMKVMRARGEMEQTESLRRADPIPGVYDGLNALGRVPWTIHTRVLDVAEQLFQNESRGQGIAGLPTLDDTAIPPLPSGGDPEDEAYKQEVRAARRLVEKVKQTNRELYSLRMDTKLKLGVAQAMRDFQRIYFPYSIDFRGRSYPVPPHLNHLGSDMCRALLIFSEKKPLGPEGLRWLKIHLANLYGNDKLSFDGRADWIDEVMDEVLDSAARPLSGRRWWLGAENPFQALSVCDEIRKAIDSGDPASYMSCVPVHMDGSCNGLQHYAALGRDYGGGQAVNLIPSDKPQDVYTKVMHMVIDQLERDAKDGEEEEKELANLLRGHVTRKVVKQTVMTSVYGVTFVGARKQIHARLEDRFLTPGVPASDELDRQLYRMAKYLAGVTLDQMNNLFKEARVIMAWLANCADKVSQAGVTSAAQMGVTQAGHPMSWVTPLGLPVVQVSVYEY